MPEEDRWVGRAAPVFKPTCSGETLLGAVDTLVRATVAVRIEPEYDIFDEEIV